MTLFLTIFMYSVTIVGSITMILCWSLLCFAIMKFKQRAANNDIYPIIPFFHYSTLITMTAFALSSTIMLIMCIVYHSNKLLYFQHYFFMTMVTANVLTFTFSKISLYILFIGRLYYSFTGSVYSLSRRSKITIALLFTGSVFGAAVILYHEMIGLVLFAVFEMLLCSTILVLFVRRLLKVLFICLISIVIYFVL